MSIPVTISTSSVPTSFCPQNIATDWPFLVGLLSAYVNDEVSLFSIGATTPDPDDRDKPWLRLDANGRLERIYYYVQGSWLSRHPIPAGAIMLYEGSLASIETYDGGESGTVTAIGGPMWEEVTELRGKFPVGVGTFTDSGEAVAVEGTGGHDEVNVNIQRKNLPDFQLEFPLYPDANGGITIDEHTGAYGVGDDNGYNTTKKTTKAAETLSVGDGEAITLDIRPPYYGVYFIRRTERLFYRV